MKLTLTRLLDTGRILATDVGQELSFFFTYMAEFVDQTIRALRNGLTFQDNFACEIKTVTLSHGVAQPIQVTKTATGIIATRVISTSQILTGFNWFYDSNGQVNVIANFSGGANTRVEVVLVILFG